MIFRINSSNLSDLIRSEQSGKRIWPARVFPSRPQSLTGPDENSVYVPVCFASLIAASCVVFTLKTILLYESTYSIFF
jgi:hypothetical protein